MTAAQQRALDRCWPRWGLNVRDGAIDFDAVFGRRAPRVLELGYGGGESLLVMAASMPERDFIGVEVYPAGIGKLLLGIEREGVANLRVYRAEASEVLRRCITAAHTGYGTAILPGSLAQTASPQTSPSRR